MSTLAAPADAARPAAPLPALIGHDADDTDRPDWRDPDSHAMRDVWQRCRDAYEGTEALLRSPTRYIFKHPKEKPSDYKARVAHSACFNAYAATIDGMVGLAFAKPPVLSKDVPRALVAHAENIDGSGTPLPLFARELTEDGFTTGTAGFMVLYPPRPAGATAQDEKNGTLRPYWRRIAVEDVYSWDVATVGAKEVVTQLVVREHARQRKGRFGSQLVVQYREFRQDVTGPEGLNAPVTYIVWEERKQEKASKADLVPVSVGEIVTAKGQPLSRIPYVGVLLGKKRNRFLARPHFLDLLDLMLKAFRIDSDRSYLMHQACVPIPVRKGFVNRVTPDGKPLPTPSGAAAANVMMDLPADTQQSSGSDFRWVEIQGTAFAPTGDELEKLKAEMGAMGMNFLAPSKRAAETAESYRLDARIENASLSSFMSTVESAIEEGLILHAEYMGLDETAFGEQSGGSFTINRDYERTILSDTMVKTYSELVLAEQLTLETFLEILAQGRALPEGFDVQKELRRLLMLASGGEDGNQDATRRRPGATDGTTEAPTDESDDGDASEGDDGPDADARRVGRSSVRA
ncbi:DUF4055 domain-containing protein [Gemmatimonas sp.]